VSSSHCASEHISCCRHGFLECHIGYVQTPRSVPVSFRALPKTVPCFPTVTVPMILPQVDFDPLSCHISMFSAGNGITLVCICGNVNFQFFADYTISCRLYHLLQATPCMLHHLLKDTPSPMGCTISCRLHHLLTEGRHRFKACIHRHFV